MIYKTNFFNSLGKSITDIYHGFGQLCEQTWSLFRSWQSATLRFFRQLNWFFHTGIRQPWYLNALKDVVNQHSDAPSFLMAQISSTLKNHYLQTGKFLPLECHLHLIDKIAWLLQKQSTENDSNNQAVSSIGLIEIYAKKFGLEITSCSDDKLTSDLIASLDKNLHHVDYERVFGFINGKVLPNDLYSNIEKFKQTTAFDRMCSSLAGKPKKVEKAPLPLVDFSEIKPVSHLKTNLDRLSDFVRNYIRSRDSHMSFFSYFFDYNRGVNRANTLIHLFDSPRSPIAKWLILYAMMDQPNPGRLQKMMSLQLGFYQTEICKLEILNLLKQDYPSLDQLTINSFVDRFNVALNSGATLQHPQIKFSLEILDKIVLHASDAELVAEKPVI